MPKVKEVMNSEIIPISPGTPIMDAANQMVNYKTGVVPVCSQGKFRGIITEADIINAVVTNKGDINTITAKAAINKKCPLISPGADLLAAANLMARKNARVLPVVQNDKLLGLFSIDDIAMDNPGMATMVFSLTMKNQVLKVNK